MTTTSTILQENDRRLTKLIEYNPITAEDCEIERFPFKVTPDGAPIYLPKSMEYLYGGMKSLQEESDDFAYDLKRLSANRIRHDFIYWCFTCGYVQDKRSGKDVPFKLNLPQRKIIKKLMDQWDNDDPIRLQVLKSRQLGSSTVIDFFAGWIQLIHCENWHSAIITQLDDQARNIRNMYKKMLRYYPIDNYTLDNFEGSQKAKIIKERGCIQYISSYQNPDSLRSGDIKILHASEVGTWQSTPTKTPEELIAAVSSSIPNEPKTMQVYESTAQGLNFFHTMWENNQKEDGYASFFSPWYLNPFDTKKLSDDQKISLAENLSDYEQTLWEAGATLEGIAFYRDKLKDLNYNEDLMKQERPSFPEEAFRTSGSPAFASSYIKNLDPHIRKPDLVGDIFGKTQKGEEAFEDLEIKEVPNGNLNIWAMPNDPPVPDGMVMKGVRYIIPLDIGGISKGSDYTSIPIIDRYWRAVDPENGVSEVVGEWHGHLDPDLVAWKGAQIAFIYNNGLFVPENNTYNSRYQKTEGDHSFTVIDEIADVYDNVYASTPVDKLRPGMPVKYGFNTNRSTKPLVVDTYRGILRDSGYVEPCREAVNEARYFEIKTDGSFGAVDGKHDDRLMARMIGFYIDSKLPLPVLVEEKSYRKEIDKPIVRGHAEM